MPGGLGCPSVHVGHGVDVFALTHLQICANRAEDKPENVFILVSVREPMLRTENPPKRDVKAGKKLLVWLLWLQRLNYKI